MMIEVLEYIGALLKGDTEMKNKRLIDANKLKRQIDDELGKAITIRAVLEIIDEQPEICVDDTEEALIREKIEELRNKGEMG